MHISKQVKMLFMLIGFLLSLLALKYTFSTSQEVSLGYVVSQRCKQNVHEYLSKIEKQGIDVSYLPIHNNEGGFFTIGTEYVNLSATKFDKKYLASVMNGSLYKCGRDGYIESKLDDKHLLSDLKNYVKVLKNKGIEGSLIVEIKGNDVLIHENSKYTLDMMRSHAK